MKKYILYSGVIVCFIACFMICMFWGVQKKPSLHSYTTKMDLLAQDNILDSVKREVSDFLWCGYSPDTYMELEQKSEVPRSEIFPYVYSTPILKAYQIEKQAYAGSFDSIPVVLQAVLSFLQDRQWNGNPPFLREIFPIFSSLSRVQINYESIPERHRRHDSPMPGKVRASRRGKDCSPDFPPNSRRTAVSLYRYCIPFSAAPRLSAKLFRTTPPDSSIRHCADRAQQ